MKKVLLISYFFPPDQAIGSLRMKGLAKYLPEFGWEAIIVTKNVNFTCDLPFQIIQTPYDEYNIFTYTKKLLGLSTKVAVRKQLGLTANKNKKFFMDYVLNFSEEVFAYPDVHKNWYNHAVDASSDIMRNEKIDAIISSSMPLTSHIIARGISKKYNVLWIADLRDLWTQNPYYHHSLIRKFFEQRLEKKVLKDACFLVTTTNKSKQILESLHPNSKVKSIPNGFDSDDMKFTNSIISPDKFTISYTGTLYNGKRDPMLLFMALNQLIVEEKINPNCIEVNFYGPEEEWMLKQIQEYDLQTIVKNHGICPRDYINIKQAESHLLLLLLWNNPDENSVCPGKIYEYLVAQKPIMAIGGPKGVVSEFLDETMAGEHVTSLEEIKTLLKKYYDEYLSYGKLTYSGIPEIIDKYSQREMARKFSLILDDCI